MKDPRRYADGFTRPPANTYSGECPKESLDVESLLTLHYYMVILNSDRGPIASWQIPATQTTLKVADEVWIAAALLHRDHPDALRLRRRGDCPTC
jgi:hypothetical protein